MYGFDFNQIYCQLLLGPIWFRMKVKCRIDKYLRDICFFEINVKNISRVNMISCIPRMAKPWVECMKSYLRVKCFRYWSRRNKCPFYLFLSISSFFQPLFYSKMTKNNQKFVELLFVHIFFMCVRRPFCRTTAILDFVSTLVETCHQIILV